MLDGTNLTALPLGKRRFVAAALRAIERGYWVLACRLDKRPWTANGLHDATRDPDVVLRWADECDEPQLAIACQKSGVVVVDIDDRQFFEQYIAASGLALPPTLTAATPSRGRHLVFLARAGASYMSSLPGADVKHNGYVLIYPSEAYSKRSGAIGKYSWLNALAPTPAPVWLETHTAEPTVRSRCSLGGAANLAELRDLLEYIHPDARGYDGWITIVLCIHDVTGGSQEGLEIADAWSARGAKYVPGDVARRWRGFKPGAGRGMAVIAAVARDHGADLAGIALRHASGEGAGTAARPQGVEEAFGSALPVPAPTSPPKGPDPAIRAAELRSRMLCGHEAKVRKTCSYVVKGLLDLGTLSDFFGPPGVGKSFVSLDLANAVAHGREWAGRKTRKGLVFVISAEGAGAYENRVVAVRGGPSDLLRVIATTVDFFSGETDAKALAQLIEEEVEKHGEPVLIIIDTLARSMAGGDENSATDMGLAVSRLDLVRTITKAHVAVVHHTGKDEDRGSRGSSALPAAVDTEIKLSSSGTGVELKVRKQRDLDTGAPIYLELETVVLDEDEETDPITSRRVRCFASTGSKRGGSLGGAQRLVLDLLREYGRDHASISAVSSGRSEVSRRGFISFAADRRTDVEPGNRKTSVRNALTRLKDNGEVDWEDDALWVVE